MIEPHPKSITFTFYLEGRTVCGQEQRPERCEDCSEMSNCILDCFYDALSKGDDCDSSAKESSDVLDANDEWRKYIRSFKDEDPLFMAFSDGYDYCKKELRTKERERMRKEMTR